MQFSSNNDNNNDQSLAKFLNPKIVSKKVNDYTFDVGFNEHPIARELRLETAKHARSIMMGDPTEAAFFGLFLKSMNAKTVVEVGVFTGYTTLIMADALGPSGKIVGLDINPEFVQIGEPYWKSAGVDERIEMKYGPAVESLRDMITTYSETVDFAFIDADKTNYKNYYELLLPLMRQGGIIALDNVLWGGKVVDETVQDDDDTNALRDISQFIKTDSRVEHVLLPFADGITLVRKK